MYNFNMKEVSPPNHISPPFSPLSAKLSERGWSVSEKEIDRQPYRIIVFPAARAHQIEAVDVATINRLQTFCDTHNLQLRVISPQEALKGITLPEDAWNMANFDYSVYSREGNLKKTFFSVMAELYQLMRKGNSSFDRNTVISSLIEQQVILLPKTYE